ncbi:hypothetical protein JCM10207_007253 [Rhodosporidiobolus poonsookiae]
MTRAAVLVDLLRRLGPSSSPASVPPPPGRWCPDELVASKVQKPRQLHTPQQVIYVPDLANVLFDSLINFVEEASARCDPDATLEIPPKLSFILDYEMRQSSPLGSYNKATHQMTLSGLVKRIPDVVALLRAALDLEHQDRTVGIKLSKLLEERDAGGFSTRFHAQDDLTLCESFEARDEDGQLEHVVVDHVLIMGQTSRASDAHGVFTRAQEALEELQVFELAQVEDADVQSMYATLFALAAARRHTLFALSDTYSFQVGIGKLLAVTFPDDYQFICHPSGPPPPTASSALLAAYEASAAVPRPPAPLPLKPFFTVPVPLRLSRMVTRDDLTRTWLGFLRPETEEGPFVLRLSSSEPGAYEALTAHASLALMLAKTDTDMDRSVLPTVGLYSAVVDGVERGLSLLAGLFRLHAHGLSISAHVRDAHGLSDVRDPPIGPARAPLPPRWTDLSAAARATRHGCRGARCGALRAAVRSMGLAEEKKRVGEVAREAGLEWERE